MSPLYRTVNLLFDLLDLAILLRVLFSWVRMDPYNPIVQLVDRVTEPILAPLRRWIGPIGGLDITPMIAMILLTFVQRIVLTLLR